MLLLMRFKLLLCIAAHLVVKMLPRLKGKSKVFEIFLKTWFKTSGSRFTKTWISFNWMDQTLWNFPRLLPTLWTWSQFLFWRHICIHLRENEFQSWTMFQRILKWKTWKSRCLKCENIFWVFANSVDIVCFMINLSNVLV